MHNRCLTLIFVLIVAGQTAAQPNPENFSILFYNVENLFDPADDPLPGDDNFTPEGEMHWTHRRLNRKLLNLSKVILSSGGWNKPDIIALCEIENRRVLEKLLNNTPLQELTYKIIHKDSPDHRGIDVAMLYNSNSFYPIAYEHYALNPDVKTREILYVSGVLNQRDTVHFFVNHWPSRYSGLLETKALRALAAETLRKKADELFDQYRTPKIVIVGDFNDAPQDESIRLHLNANPAQEAFADTGLYNLSYFWGKPGTGTMKYQSQWYVFDQVIVSGALLNATRGYCSHPDKARIVDLPFLMEADKRYAGKKPFRTYYGFTYQGGFSDHLPVLLELKYVP